MIKLPVQVRSSTNARLAQHLAEAHDELERLDAEGGVTSDERGTLYPSHRGCEG